MHKVYLTLFLKSCPFHHAFSFHFIWAKREEKTVEKLFFRCFFVCSLLKFYFLLLLCFNFLLLNERWEISFLPPLHLREVVGNETKPTCSWWGFLNVSSPTAAQQIFNPPLAKSSLAVIALRHAKRKRPKHWLFSFNFLAALPT